ncbi:MAG: hypothetical protein JO048_03535 [Methylobacteriaceae bacterium]|nr:hypothetical protein [Methylobacteriaceae bacterium]
MTQHAIAAAFGAAAFLLGSFGATAQDQSALRQWCTGDYLRFCGQFKPNTPEVEQCFRTHMKELSPQCQSSIAAYTKEGGRGVTSGGGATGERRR